MNCCVLRSNGFDKGPRRRLGWWNQDVVLCQKAPQMGILLPEP
jgi:hypothetical protein